MQKETILMVSGCGPKVGKDEFSNICADLIDVNYPDWIQMRGAFASELKVECELKYSIDKERALTDPIYKESIRKYYIQHGNDGRMEDLYMWPKKLDANWPGIKEPYKDRRVIKIISDCRYLNEVDHYKYYYKPAGLVIVVYITISEEIIIARFGMDYWAKWKLTQSDRSEREMQHYPHDFVISNNYSVKYLRRCAESILQEILK